MSRMNTYKNKKNSKNRIVKSRRSESSKDEIFKESRVSGRKTGKVSDRGRKRKRKKKSHKVRNSILAIVLAALLGTLGYVLVVGMSTGIIPVGIQKDYFNNGKGIFLIVGSDMRTGYANGRTDTILLASLDFKAGKANILSVPRDTLVTDLPGNKGGNSKLNAAYAYGGIDETKMELEKLYNIKIDKTVDLGFDTFAKIVDTLGGININVDMDMYKPSENINLKAGDQKLTGAQALAYVRFRGTPIADIGRMERQQKFLTTLAGAVKSNGNIATQATVLQEILSNIKTNVTFEEAIYSANKFIKTKNFEIQTITSAVTPVEIDGVDYVQATDSAFSDGNAYLNFKMLVYTNPKTKVKTLVTPVQFKGLNDGTIDPSTLNTSEASDFSNPASGSVDAYGNPTGTAS